MTRAAPRYVAQILPRDARDALIVAAATDPHRAPTESRDRRLAVDDAIERIKFKYPQFFQIEKE